MAPTIPDDHDQTFKNLITEFFSDFMNLFFAEWANRFDLTSVEWLNTELFPDPPQGNRHRTDLTAKLKTHQEVPGYGKELLALVLIEVESRDSTTSIKARLPYYYLYLRDRSKLPVLPIVLYLDVGLNGLGEDTTTEAFWHLDIITMKYLYVGLPALDGVAYAEGDNYLGVALSALMKLPKDRIRELGKLALEKILAANLTELQKHFLTTCFEKYTPLNSGELDEIRRTIPATQQEASGSMLRRNLTTYERALINESHQQGRNEGLDEGRVEGRSEGRAEGELTAARAIVELFLKSQFGDIPVEATAVYQGYTAQQLQQLALAIPKAQSLQELGLLPPNPVSDPS